LMGRRSASCISTRNASEMSRSATAFSRCVGFVRPRASVDHAARGPPARRRRRSTARRSRVGSGTSRRSCHRRRGATSVSSPPAGVSPVRRRSRVRCATAPAPPALRGGGSVRPTRTARVDCPHRRCGSRSKSTNNEMNADISNDNRRAASTTATTTPATTTNVIPVLRPPRQPRQALPTGGLDMFRSGHHAGSQALALAA